jgi:hypothetical protein
VKLGLSREGKGVGVKEDIQTSEGGGYRRVEKIA